MKQLYSVILLVFGLHFGFGQIFEERIITDSASSPLNAASVYAADIDGDGDMDMLSASPEDDKIAWYENLNGQGVFGRQRVITTSANSANYVYAIDLDNDGDVDVLSTSANDTKVAWYENLDGHGSFGPQQVIGNLSAVSMLGVADINNDGYLDVVSASGYQDKVVWYMHIDGQGNFGAEQIISNVSFGARYVYVGDIDGDSDFDVLTSDRDDNNVVWYENLDGLGSFGTEQIISTVENGGKQIHLVDFDNDNDLDVLSMTKIQAFCNSCTNDIIWYENLDSQGGFDTEKNIATDLNFFTLKASDIDLDGDLDVIASISPTEIAWFENLDGNQNFGAQQFITSNIGSVTWIHATDTDGDGDIDVLSASSDDKIAWYDNADGNGTFGFQNVVAANVERPITAISADLDGDGDFDVITTSGFYNNIVWYENVDGLGDIRNQRTIIRNNGDVSSLHTADLDGDGDVDLLSTSYNGDKVEWHENLDGLGNFGTPEVISSNTDGAKFVFAADIDGDGDMDVISASSNDDKIAWYENTNGFGDFGLQQVITTSANVANSVFAADLDNDGDLDVLSSSSSDDKIAWYENENGLGAFGFQQVITTNANAANLVFAADLDNDGDQDVLSTSRLDDKVAWYQNLDSNGNFGTQQIISVNADGANTVVACDLDGDNDLDVLTSSGFDNKIAWYENTDGLGAFGVEQIVTLNANDARSIVAVDLDSDGDLDLLSSSWLDDKIAWYKNLSDNFNQIQGTIRSNLDLNSCDELDMVLSSILVSTDSGSGTTSTFTNFNGFYELLTDEGNYITSIVQLPSYFDSNPENITTNFTGFNNIDVVDFCLEPVGTIDDLEISMFPVTEARPGYDVSYQIVYKNVGTTVINDGFITLDYDNNKINFQNSNQIPFLETSNSLAFDYTDLQPFEVRTINLDFSVYTIPQVSLGDILNFDVEITPFTQDLTPSNNSFTLQQTIIGSYDPNDITVLEGEEILIDDIDKYLHYLIRFQNTGTASAINVRVEHILDDKLDWTTMQLESLSHTGRVEIENETDVSFIFNSINLPDSTNDEPNSHGYIAFKIKPKSNVQVGDIISGVADIYFDFNPPITTNTVNTEIVEPLSIDEVSAETVKLYPNPARNTIRITSNQVIEELTVMDINGRALQSLEISTTDYSLDISDLSKGVYFLDIESGDFKVTKKFIKN